MEIWDEVQMSLPNLSHSLGKVTGGRGLGVGWLNGRMDVEWSDELPHYSFFPSFFGEERGRGGFFSSA
jgi:hypothetical protein